MATGRGWSLAAAIVALALVAAVSPVRAALQDENLLTSMPTGFVVGDAASRGGEDIAEYVPTGENVNAWSRMITVQVFHGHALAGPDSFAATLAANWKQACPGGGAAKSKAGAEDGYPFSLWAFECPLNPATGKPETMFLKVIGGHDALYSVQYAYRQAATRELVGPAISFLQQARVCDTRRADRACPAGM